MQLYSTQSILCVYVAIFFSRAYLRLWTDFKMAQKLILNSMILITRIHSEKVQKKYAINYYLFLFHLEVYVTEVKKQIKLTLKYCSVKNFIYLPNDLINIILYVLQIELFLKKWIFIKLQRLINEKSGHLVFDIMTYLLIC